MWEHPFWQQPLVVAVEVDWGPQTSNKLWCIFWYIPLCIMWCKSYSMSWSHNPLWTPPAMSVSFSNQKWLGKFYNPPFSHYLSMQLPHRLPGLEHMVMQSRSRCSGSCRACGAWMAPFGFVEANLQAHCLCRSWRDLAAPQNNTFNLQNEAYSSWG